MAARNQADLLRISSTFLRLTLLEGSVIVIVRDVEFDRVLPKQRVLVEFGSRGEGEAQLRVSHTLRRDGEMVG